MTGGLSAALPVYVQAAAMTIKTKKTKNILAESKLAPSKGLGQNFLVNSAVCEQIVRKSGITADDTVIELGVGLGALTEHLAAVARHVVGIEIDAGIVRYHQENNDLPDNVTLLHQDLLKTDFGGLAEKFGMLKIAANLPYSISNPALFKFFAEQESIDWAILMLQKEVAQRIASPPGSKEYGVLSVLLSVCASVEMLMRVGPANFHPRPKVDSAVVRIKFLHERSLFASLTEEERVLFVDIVNAAFRQRRKTLLNSLSAGLPNYADKKSLSNALSRADIDPKVRPEKLNGRQFIALVKAIMAS